MSYKRHYDYIDRATCYTAFPPLSASTGRPLQRAWSYLSQWHDRQSVFLASGVPDMSIMLDSNPASPTAYDGYLHIPLRPPDPTDAPAHERQYGIDIWEWPYDWAAIGAGVRSACLIPDFVGAPAVMTDIGLSASGSATTATYGDEAIPFAHRYHDMVIPSNAGGWWHAAIRLRRVVLANCSISPFPPPPPLIAGQEQCVSETFGVGRVIRGHDAGTCEGSLGTITRLVGDGAGTAEDMECLTRRLLMSWAHPVGLWLDTMSGGITILDQTVRCLSRDLRGAGGSMDAEPALVITASDPDTEIVWSNPTTGDTWTYTTTGAEVETMITPAMGVGVAGTGIEITDGTETDLKLSVSSPDDSDELIIHTAQIWEGDAW